MTRIATDLRISREAADRLRYAPVGVPTATDVQNAIDNLANTVANPTQPPVISATTVNFAQSPYAVQSNDFILEVDTTGGVVVITPQAVATRTQPLEIKDVSLNAFTNNIQVTGPIEGQNPYLINSDGGSLTIRPNKAKTAYEVVTW